MTDLEPAPRSGLDRGVERWIVLSVGSVVVVVGTGVAALLGWVLAGGLIEAAPVDPETVPWSAVVVPLPEGTGELQYLHRGVGRSMEERRLRLVPSGGAPVELPLFEVGARPVDLTVAWLPPDGRRSAAVLVRDRAGALVIDVSRGRMQRLWVGGDRRWLVDVTGPWPDPATDDGSVPVVSGRALDVTDDWPPARSVGMGRITTSEAGRLAYVP